MRNNTLDKYKNNAPTADEGIELLSLLTSPLLRVSEPLNPLLRLAKHCMSGTERQKHQLQIQPLKTARRWANTTKATIHQLRKRHCEDKKYKTTQAMRARYISVQAAKTRNLDSAATFIYRYGQRTRRTNILLELGLRLAFRQCYKLYLLSSIGYEPGSHFHSGKFSQLIFLIDRKFV